VINPELRDNNDQDYKGNRKSRRQSVIMSTPGILLRKSVTLPSAVRFSFLVGFFSDTCLLVERHW
jgi:hypothetical protein